MFSLRLAMILICYSLSISTAFAIPDFVPPVNEQKIQKLLNNWRASSGIPGAALSIYTPNHPEPMTFASGTSQFHGGNSISKNTLFQAGSITKSFTSMIILKLEAQGKLSIDDPITKYLPQYPQWDNVTIRQLLNHTSGIPNYTNTARFNQIRKDTPQQGFTPDQLVKMAGSHRLFAPGKGWKYSNTNYVLAGMIIEKVSGTPLNQIMHQYLHNNPQMNLMNTYYYTGLYPDSYLSRMAHGYTSAGKDVTTQDISWAHAAGAIVTTSEDLLAWWYDLMTGSILPQPQLQEMMSLVCEGRTPGCRSGEPISHLRSGDIGYGYGLGIIETSSGSNAIGPVWWHNGTTAGYRAIVMWFPKSDIYVSLTINQGAGYLLKPTIPLVRNLMSVLMYDANPSLAQSINTRVKNRAKKIKSKVQHLAHRHKKPRKNQIATKKKPAHVVQSTLTEDETPINLSR